MGEPKGRCRGAVPRAGIYRDYVHSSVLIFDTHSQALLTTLEKSLLSPFFSYLFLLMRSLVLCTVLTADMVRAVIIICVGTQCRADVIRLSDTWGSVNLKEKNL